MTPAVHGGCESLSGTTFPECFEDYMDLRSLQNSCRGPTGASGRVTIPVVICEKLRAMQTPTLLPVVLPAITNVTQ